MFVVCSVINLRDLSVLHDAMNVFAFLVHVRCHTLAIVY